MTLITPFDDSESTDRSLAAAERLLERAGLVLAELNEKISNNDIVAAAGAKAALTEFTSAFHTAMKERNRVADDRKKANGIVGDYAVDFDAARAEIGRRLACLRAVSDG
jgi:hypothetical protein